jgi:hypothetical protein
VTVDLILTIGFMALNYWALTRVIHQAGFSRAWIILPLLPMGLSIACAVITYNDLRGALLGYSLGFFGFSHVGFLWDLDMISLFLNWVFFLIFAFSRWPSVGGGGVANQPTGRPGSYVTSAAVAPATTRPRGVTRDYGSTATATAPVTAPAPIALSVVVKHCVWCAEPLPGSRALFHDCGPKTRPPIFCEKCGSTLNQVGDCPACGSAG